MADVQHLEIQPNKTVIICKIVITLRNHLQKGPGNGNKPEGKKNNQIHTARVLI